METPVTPSRVWCLATLLCLSPLVVFGQTTPAPAAEKAPPPGHEVLVLDTFNVSASPTVGYRADKTVSGTLIATDVNALPASVQVITSALLEDMGTRRVEDSIRFVSGVGLSARNEGANGGTRTENFIVRGFATSQLLRNGIRMQGITNSANIERVEILKGPSSIFFGAADPGGVVNVITKQPLPRQFGELELVLGDNNYSYLELDYNQPVIEKKLSFRLMGSWLAADGWQKFWRDEQLYLAGAVTWDITPTTRLTIESQYRKQEGIQERMGTVFLSTDNPAPFAQQLLTGDALRRSIELGILTPTDTYDEDGTFNSFSLLQKAGEHVVFSADVGSTDGNRLQQTTVTRNRIAIADNYSYFDRPGIVSIGAINRTINVKALVMFDALGVKNKVVVGWDRSEIGNKEVYYAWANNSPYTTKRYLFDVAPDSSTYNVIRYPTFADVGTVGGPVAIINNPWTKPIWQQGFYITEQASLMDERLNIVAGARWSDLRVQGRETWTPQLGASYAVNKALAVYGLYSESFKPNGRSSTIDPTAPYFPPENGVGKEIGVKLSLLEDRLTGTVALFQVDKHNVRRVDSGAVVQGRNGATLTDGERSDGVEVDLIWTPVPTVSVIAAYAHTDARVVSDVINPATSPDLNNDGIPDTIGMPLAGTSPNTYSLWAKYEFPAGPLNGFSAGVGYQRREGPIPLDASYARSKVTQDTYDRVDLLLAYGTKAFGHPVKLQLNVNNVGDELYADRYLGYADPRTIRFTISTRF
jgi:iron complex outermembrane receptor protein